MQTERPTEEPYVGKPLVRFREGAGRKLPALLDKLLPSQILEIVKKEGYTKFGMHQHTQLWKKLDAKNPSKGYGTMVADKYWHWYESWVNKVLEHCLKNKKEYK